MDFTLLSWLFLFSVLSIFHCKVCFQIMSVHVRAQSILGWRGQRKFIWGTFNVWFFLGSVQDKYLQIVWLVENQFTTTPLWPMASLDGQTAISNIKFRYLTRYTEQKLNNQKMIQVQALCPHMIQGSFMTEQIGSCRSFSLSPHPCQIKYKQKNASNLKIDIKNWKN